MKLIYKQQRSIAQVGEVWYASWPPLKKDSNEIQAMGRGYLNLPYQRFYISKILPDGYISFRINQYEPAQIADNWSYLLKEEDLITISPSPKFISIYISGQETRYESISPLPSGNK